MPLSSLYGCSIPGSMCCKWSHQSNRASWLAGRCTRRRETSETEEQTAGTRFEHDRLLHVHSSQGSLKPACLTSRQEQPCEAPLPDKAQSIFSANTPSRNRSEAGEHKIFYLALDHNSDSVIPPNLWLLNAFLTLNRVLSFALQVRKYSVNVGRGWEVGSRWGGGGGQARPWAEPLWTGSRSVECDDGRWHKTAPKVICVAGEGAPQLQETAGTQMRSSSPSSLLIPPGCPGSFQTRRGQLFFPSNPSIWESFPTYPIGADMKPARLPASKKAAQLLTHHRCTH